VKRFHVSFTIIKAAQKWKALVAKNRAARQAAAAAGDVNIELVKPAKMGKAVAAMRGQGRAAAAFRQAGSPTGKAGAAVATAEGSGSPKEGGSERSSSKKGSGNFHKLGIVSSAFKRSGRGGSAGSDRYPAATSPTSPDALNPRTLPPPSPPPPELLALAKSASGSGKPIG